jgi:hypothetical protein
MQCNNHEHNVDLAFLPKITTTPTIGPVPSSTPIRVPQWNIGVSSKVPNHKMHGPTHSPMNWADLAQDITNREKGTNTICFIPHSKIPQD